MPGTDRHPLLEQLRSLLDRIPAMAERELEAEYIAVLGRKQGSLTTLLKGLPTLPPEQRKALGSAGNALRQELEGAFDARRETLRAERDRQFAQELDLTMPARNRWVGVEHPVTQVIDEIVGIFWELGFTRAVGPEAETEWHNFVALNFPPDHPAMDMHDTLYLDTGDRRRSSRRRGRSSGVSPDHERRRPTVDRRTTQDGRILLRTHTSPVQIRTMLAYPPPIRVVIPGMCYRKDTFDPSHAPAFSQIEGLAVDVGISFVDLKATLAYFARRFFGATRKVRFRPSYFPFTEPSAEMDVSCGLCGGSGCPACKGSGWMEILGCGMVHPSVLEECELDPEVYTGFAWGMGPHRITMQRYGIPDIRLLYEGDMRFLGQFI